ncbi:MAG: thioredoxin family protein [Balneolaceae bacterium]|nr:thioredoxin family protein [Balneolaceae bacterium]MDR9416891.1 thioredoxin family protein [Gracilimonas sp.]
MNSARYFFLMGLTYFMGICPLVANAQKSELTGIVSEEKIIQNDRIFEIYIKRYQPDSTAIAYLANLNKEVNLKVFMGSWCRESRKYIPQLMKILQVADSDNIQVEYIAVNAQKNIPLSFLKNHQIKYIPTILVFDDRNELGRIVEKPQMPIELEIVEILKQAEKIE